jgi:hypothetical protein
MANIRHATLNLLSRAKPSTRQKTATDARAATSALIADRQVTAIDRFRRAFRKQRTV